jgi:hypothetical protein
MMGSSRWLSSAGASIPSIRGSVRLSQLTCPLTMKRRRTFIENCPESAPFPVAQDLMT